MRYRVTIATALLMSAFAVLLSACAGDEGRQDSGLPSEVVALNNRGVGLMGYFDYPGAREVFEQVVASQPEWIDARVNLAIATLNRQQEGDEARADAILQEVLAQAPQHQRAHFVAGLLRLYEGAQSAALIHFQKVAQADPGDAYAAYYTGQLLAVDYPEQALDWFERAIETDPYLRSAYYGASIALRRLRRRDEAVRMQEQYLRLESNPRARLAEFKYTRMGPKANALAVPVRGLSPAESTTAIPEGAAFAAAVPVAPQWQLPESSTLTTADLNGDGEQDLFLSRARTNAAQASASLVLLADGDGWGALADHSLSGIDGVVAAAWADFDNDGDVDAYLCRAGVDQLWYREGDSEWRLQPEQLLGLRLPGDDCRDVAAFDADHDGDVDIFVVGEQANELINNDGDGSFRALGQSQGLAGSGGGRQVLALDIDADRDTDIAVLNAQPPHALFLNDRLWQYRTLQTPAFAEIGARAMSAGDADADGQAELYLLQSASDAVTVLEWEGETFTVQGTAAVAPGMTQLSLGDYDGDGAMELLAAGEEGAVRMDASSLLTDRPSAGLAVTSSAASTLVPVLRDVAAGPGLMTVVDGALQWLGPGDGRHPFASFALVGRASEADAMRSNAAGIGTRLALRRGEYWSVTSTFDGDSSPGQSLQPVSLGLGASAQADFVAIDWSDGVFQTELDLPAGALHRIAETQRQLASCPVLFAWNGEEYAFVTDLLGVGGIGFLLAPGEYSTPRPWERMLLSEAQLSPRRGRLALKLTEPMEEVAYVDQLALHEVLVPPGWQVMLDERHSTDPRRPPSGELRWYRESLRPLGARDGRGHEVLAAVLDRDGVAVPVGVRDTRFLGRLQASQVLTMEFAAALGEQDGRARWLLADGWVEYPYSQTLFAAWQAGVTYEPPSLEVSTDGEHWQLVAARFGYPAGMPRQMALPLHDLPRGARYLRLTGNLEIYWDRLRVALVEPAPTPARVTPLPLQRAVLSQVGFPVRTTHAQRRPHFDYGQRQTFWDTRYTRGAYTAFGDVRELVGEQDDALALVGAGEELHAEFAASASFPGEGWSRRYLLTTAGWAKDMDLYTRDGDSVDPMPHRSDEPGVLARRDALHARFHTRPLSGK
ncbi:MAG: FG-GAP-like repeat-containing protein [Pseudomonadota bacterium]